MARLLVLLIYNLIYPVMLLVMTPAALKKMKARGGQWRDLWQRLGFFSAEVRGALNNLHQGREVLWMHAVSVGEVGIAAKLVRELIRQRPQTGVVLTTTTPTGMAQAQKLATDLPGSVVPLYSPLDGWFVVRRCLKAIRPRQIVLVEAEVWPNLVFAASKQDIPVRLVNARLSPRSERRYQKLRFLIAPIFTLLDQVMVQEPEDVARWTSLGLAPERVSWTGSIKFDEAGDKEPVEQIASFRTLLDEEGVSRSRPVLLAASTHPGEELEISRVFLQLKVDHPGLFLILVPRHVERAGEIQETLRRIELKVRLRSHAERPQASAPDCLLVDTTGELRAWQALATLVATGGQNPAEAVMAGKPVLFGPHMENFSALIRVLLARGGAVQVADFPELKNQVKRLLSMPAEAGKIARAGHEALRSHEGATRRTTDRLIKQESSRN